ncbi:uncharacterized protein BP5553_00945 [Venustampulla echinocandica]|uniref:2EXR domain-containing protein n=1 Tax=Venustampulla echinocandica TaxID=2656787 RepID=A0A370TZL4_9HELO|nr:uncharacterized protein BP5553_00945 [Venustampulla echinocandica]RDL40966.1 hypothetical protein BP5553_00945 [Venustampulla echinocandica]
MDNANGETVSRPTSVASIRLEASKEKLINASAVNSNNPVSSSLDSAGATGAATVARGDDMGAIKNKSDLVSPSENEITVSPIQETPPVMAKNLEISPHELVRGSAHAIGQQFTLFPKLSVELRCIIWKLALPGTRFVTIRKTKCLGDGVEPYWEPVCAEKAPSLLFVCREARAEALKTYVPIKGTVPESSAIYCDFNRDYVCFDNYILCGCKCRAEEHMSVILEQLVAQIKSGRLCYVAMSIFNVTYLRDYHQPTSYIFQYLKELTVGLPSQHLEPHLEGDITAIKRILVDVELLAPVTKNVLREIELTWPAIMKVGPAWKPPRVSLGVFGFGCPPKFPNVFYNRYGQRLM